MVSGNLSPPGTEHSVEGVMGLSWLLDSSTLRAIAVEIPFMPVKSPHTKSRFRHILSHSSASPLTPLWDKNFIISFSQVRSGGFCPRQAWCPDHPWAFESEG